MLCEKSLSTPLELKTNKILISDKNHIYYNDFFFALFLFYCNLHQSEPFVIMKTINGSSVFDGYVIAIFTLLAEKHNFS